MIKAIVFVVAGLLTVQAQARGRAVESRSVEKAAKERTEVSKAVSQKGEAAQRSEMNNQIDNKAKASENVENCTGNCEVPQILEDITYNNGTKRDLSQKALANVNVANARANQLVRQGVPAEKATEQALTEMGLNPKEVRENCK